MPKVTQYTPDQVTTQFASQPRARVTGVDYSPLVKGLSDIGTVAGDISTRIDTTSAEDALVKFEKAKNDLFFNSDSGYFNTQGRNAYDQSNTTNQMLLDLKKQHGADLSDRARRMFDTVADKHIISSQADIMKHSSQGLQAWEVATIDAQVENTLENSSLYWNQPDKLKVQRVIGEQSILESAKMKGIGPVATNEKLQTFRSQFAAGTINAAIAKGSIDGKEALDKYGDQLEGPLKVKAEKAIATKQKVEKTKFNAQQATLTATRIVNDYDNRSEIIDEVNKIKDPELLKSTMSQAMYAFNMKKTAESEARGETFEAAEKHILNGGSAETFKAQDPEGWEKLSPKQQQSISTDKPIVTDQVWLSNTLLLPKNELAKVNPADHFDKLSVGDRSKLTSAVKTARGTGTKTEKDESQIGRTRTSQTNLAVEQLFGKKSKWKKKDISKVNSFYSMLDGEVSYRESQKGAKLTSEEYTGLLSGLTREVVQEGIIFDSEIDITEIPAEDMSQLTKFLHDNNIPVTSDNLLKVYQQASK